MATVFAGPLDIYLEAPATGRVTQSQRTRAEKIGLAVILNSGRPGLEGVLQVVGQAIYHNQILFFYNDNGRAVGYVVWALLSQAKHEQMQAKSTTTLHLSEWNEGQYLWIIDLVAPRGHFSDIAKYIVSELMPRYGNISYTRKGKRGFVCVQYP